MIICLPGPGETEWATENMNVNKMITCWAGPGETEWVTVNMNMNNRTGATPHRGLRRWWGEDVVAETNKFDTVKGLGEEISPPHR